MPAHGYVIGFADLAIRQLIKHRLGRESKVFAAVQRHPESSVNELVKVVYDDVHVRLHAVAERSLLAHLHKLEDERRVRETQEKWVATA
jgi:hypothetical protein